MKSFHLITALFLCSILSLTAQDKDKKWDVANPEGDWNFKEVPLNTDEGTWMNVDVSPDGTKIVFDLLGDIYIMNTDGGKAKALRTGLPFEIQPRFSPDGKTLSFTSDAGGGDNIWTMNVDGSNAKQITKENFRLLNNAVWTPDGNYLVEPVYDEEKILTAELDLDMVIRESMTLDVTGHYSRPDVFSMSINRKR